MIYSFSQNESLENSEKSQWVGELILALHPLHLILESSCSHEINQQNSQEESFMESIIKGGVVPAFRLNKNRILHYFGKSIEITDNKMQVKEIFQRIGGFRNE